MVAMYPIVDEIAEQYAGKRVLITGASGFLGRHLVNQLEDVDCNIYCVSRQRRSDTRRNVVWLEADLADPARAVWVTRKAEPDIIFHLTSESRADQRVDTVLPTFKNDLAATVNCLLAACEIGCRRFVMTGSLEEPIWPRRRDEADPVPFSPYAAAKFACGFYGRMFYHLYKLPVVLLRPFMTYGPGQKDYKVIPYTILSLLRGQAPQLSSGDRLIDWIYVADVVDAFVRAGVAPNAPGRTLDLGSQRLVPLRLVIEKICELVGGPRPVFGVTPDRGETRAAASHEALLALNWQSRTTLDDGLRQTVKWYRRELRKKAACQYGVP